MKLIEMKSGNFPGYTTPQYDVEATSVLATSSVLSRLPVWSVY